MVRYRCAQVNSGYPWLPKMAGVLLTRLPSAYATVCMFTIIGKIPQLVRCFKSQVLSRRLRPSCTFAVFV